LAHLKTVLTLDLNTLVKPYLRVEHNADDELIKALMAAALQKSHVYLCREFEAQAEELDDIKLACLQAIAYWYENRGDTAKLPPAAIDLLQNYRFEPGF
jgi:uncharacterized phage protein (predicted DNA packaging)